VLLVQRACEAQSQRGGGYPDDVNRSVAHDPALAFRELYQPVSPYTDARKESRKNVPTPTAEYMRAYRARKKAERAEAAAYPPEGRPVMLRRRPLSEQPLHHRECASRIDGLEAEVRHLKAELATRPLKLPSQDPNSLAYHTPGYGNQYSSRPFTPVPKKRD
jgi:hypothetical protein